ncbi:MAG TPA: MerR family transcriptional regulator [Chloroflexota bacterium]|nr:MerR family transcriptional regulator [Chloroflexota bacterium]
MVEVGRPSRRARRRVRDFQFHEPNLAQIWAKLALTATQLSRLTGISRRQVEWWRRRGYLTPSPTEPDRFNGDAVTLALLIKQALDAGIPLHTAYELARKHLAETLARGAQTVTSPGEHPDASALLDLEQKLIATHNTIGLVLEAVSPLAHRAERRLAGEAGAAGAGNGA